MITTSEKFTKVLDPTLNVKELVFSEVKRIDDIANIREANIKEILRIRDEHFRELEKKESSRLDAIRQVDVLNQAATAKSSLDAIQALASTTTVNADNIRNALNTTATQMAKQTADLAATIAIQTQATSDAMTIRIAALEKAYAEGVGKERVTDPQMTILLTEIKALRESQNINKGSGEGMKSMYGWIVGGILFIITVVGFITKF